MAEPVSRSQPRRPRGLADSANPVPAEPRSTRLPALDVLRGIAILGCSPSPAT
ncbi:hypothetical protein [Nocardia sp. NBC_01388]|uniref:hypothetical protein n=1 Tax=Nocardia sp. NBC_01388 TaxID=2903596 RepID=UPI003253BAD5